MRGKLALMASVAVLGALAGCGGDDGGGGSGDKAATATSTPASKPVRVAVIMASLDNAFYVAQKQGVEEEASRQSGADVTVSAGRARTSADDVVGFIDDAIAKGVDAVAVNGSDTAPLIPALKRVIDADIPLVLFDAPADQLEGQYASYIGTDNKAGGQAAGAWLHDHMASGGNVGLLLCVAGHPVTRARVAGFKAGLDGGAFEIVAQGDAECDREKGRRVMEDMISAHPDLDAVFSSSDTQTLGAIAAFKAANKDVQFVSFDAQPEAVQAIVKGDVLDASSGWSAREIGGEAVKAAVAAARGETVEPSHIVPVTVVDKDNAADWQG
jgi:ribose transport system substrate-binding protein